MLRFLPVVLSLALTIFTLVDCIQTEDGSVRNLPKIGWIILIVLFPIVGPAAWLLAGRPARGSRTLGSQQDRWDQHRRSRGQGPQRPPRGPDDDPDFLKGI